MFELSRGRLPWLTPAPGDFRKTLKALAAGDGPADGPVDGPVDAARLVALAGHDLDIDGLIALDRARAALAPRLEGAALGRVKLALLAQATTD